MAQRRQLDMFTKGKLVGMLESSRSQTKVSRILNVDHQSVISKLWQRFQKKRDVTRQPVSDRPRVTTLAKTDIWRLTGFGAHSRPRNTNFETKCLQEIQSCGPVCQKTSSLHCPLVCAQTRSFELVFEHWSVGEWASVMFIDESRFSLSSDSRWVTIWKKRGTRFEPRNITK
ncbi:transposable element Tc3 transposase [Trichonephila clavipes]|nr:transposable element Tc3 transposase [Trichonephila clavipes]